MKSIAIAGAINGFFSPSAVRSVRFFHFSSKKRNFVVFCFPRFILFSVVKRESGDSLHVREFHCKRYHPNSVGSLLTQEVSVGLDVAFLT